MCNHDIAYLMGTADGIVCRCCGRLFANMDEIKADVEKTIKEPEETPAKPAETKPKRAPRKKKEEGA